MYSYIGSKNSFRKMSSITISALFIIVISFFLICLGGCSAAKHAQVQDMIDKLPSTYSDSVKSTILECSESYHNLSDEDREKVDAKRLAEIEKEYLYETAVEYLYPLSNNKIISQSEYEIIRNCANDVNSILGSDEISMMITNEIMDTSVYEGVSEHFKFVLSTMTTEMSQEWNEYSKSVWIDSAFANVKKNVEKEYNTSIGNIGLMYVTPKCKETSEYSNALSLIRSIPTQNQRETELKKRLEYYFLSFCDARFSWVVFDSKTGIFYNFLPSSFTSDISYADVMGYMKSGITTDKLSDDDLTKMLSGFCVFYDD